MGMKSLTEQARELGISHTTLSRRINRGLTLTQATEMTKWEHKHPPIVARSKTIEHAIECAAGVNHRLITGDDLQPVYDDDEYTANLKERVAAMKYVLETGKAFLPIAERHQRRAR